MCIIQSAAFVAVIVILTVLAVKSIPIYLHISRVSRYLVECRISRQCSAMCTAVLQRHRIVRIECRGKQWPHHCIIEVFTVNVAT